MTPENSHKTDGLEKQCIWDGCFFIGLGRSLLFRIFGGWGGVILQVIKILAKQYLYFSASL